VLNHPNPNFVPINVNGDIESIKKILQTIDISLKSNYKMLLTDTKEFKSQIDILTNDLVECNQKIEFLSKGVNGLLNPTLLELKKVTEAISRQLQIFHHIYSLRAREK